MLFQTQFRRWMIPDCKDSVDIGSNTLVSFCKLIREANWKNNISFQL